ncbi:hypothetical protein HBI81_042970 [Parastagonospora nodorum]|nr:hypothetical protein HBI95_086520 [Parastagonospora nodorum]KAH4609943.1 hypothetical protein HBH82_059160 [Parastagonospora nodorum]KAH4690996.1 hypothetical protein HBH78_081850 [Parastagonospora nodorum]KAH4705675.1 hypothetical protein HBH67_087700 [Parastagonospora nodorum]KAH4774835.1 hypothetical protein HBH63_143340 [Parastagonospora nodorum]
MVDRSRGRGQRGRGRGGTIAGRENHSRPYTCFDFQNKGVCNRKNCTYTHDLHSDGQKFRNNRPARTTETSEQQQAKKSYSAWKRHLSSEPSSSRTMQRLWGGALNILEEGDRDLSQQLPKDLDTDDQDHQGRHHIGAILNMRVRDSEAAQHVRNCQQFLLTITHSSMLDGLAVDTYVGSIYNFVSGANGTRAIPFFQHICELLTSLRTNNDPDASLDILESTLVALSVALRELLKRESRARFNDDLKALTDALGAAGTTFALDRPSVASTLVTNNVRCIRDMVARANGLLFTASSGEDGDYARISKTSSYPRDLVLPSNRHDNDKLDMAQIVIFPTRDEIMSDAKEFLPFTDPDQPHFLEDPTQRHIDTHFRLFRHDKFGELKGTLSNLMQIFSRDPNAMNNPRFQHGDMRAYRYAGVHISRVVFQRALEIQMSFPSPQKIALKSFAAQVKWWEESKRLENGSLLSYVWIQNEVVQHVFLTLVRKGAKDEDGQEIIHSNGLFTITAQLMTQDKATLELLMRAAAGRCQGMLLEFPKVMPATFVPILENLQSMQRTGGMPFYQWIVPARLEASSGVKTCHDIPPPLYARRAGFSFPLKIITIDDDTSLCVGPTATCDDDDLLGKIEAKTSLDRGQCCALVAALTREFAFIQGPPGTGKSYLGLHLMRVLLEIKAKAGLGPILVVCYTNHALDQFLEHLVNVGVTKVIRVGGQSKSTVLANHNLRELRRSEQNTRSEKYSAHDAYSRLDSYKTDANNVLNGLRHMRNRPDWSDLEQHISEEHKEMHCQFSQMDDEGFKMVGRHPFDIWSNTGAFPTFAPAGSPPPITALANILRKAATNVYALTFQEKQLLIRHWVEEIHEAKVGELYEVVKGAANTQKHLDNVHAEASRRVLQGADVIGLTTSGLAGRISLLKHVACKVLICEEAGEILEPHMISALLPTVEHCIQIGDHEQLRPSVSNFDDLSLESERGKNHQLDKSQFERLSVGMAGRPLVPVAQLNVQRRMRPEISTLIRETLYAKLADHTSTINMPNVVGLRENVFWLDHTHLEDDGQMEVQHSKSRSNSWEVQMVHAMVRHVVRQGLYKSSDIAVLTPYTGQLQKLRAAMRNDFEIVLSERDEEALEKDGFTISNTPQDQRVAAAAEQGRKPLQKKQLSDLLRIATVDNFQGEEAKVVIISLVRSNKAQKVGFLKTSNRINVLLSRAKHGMYIIGNADTYTTVDMWQHVIGMLRAKNSVEPSLGLCCPRHPEKVMEICEPEDFAKFSPEGGCREACIDRLDCGHSCLARCHSKAMHAAFHCEEPCERSHEPCGHSCQKQTCGEPCGKCMTKVDNIRLSCGHIHNGVFCHLTLDLTSISCHVPVSKQVLGCDHDIVVKCSQDVTSLGFRCPEPCKSTLPCGHQCPGSCGHCKSKTVDNKSVVKHAKCMEKCHRKMGTCNHACGRYCHDGTDCGLCQKPCEVRCKHSKCPHKCHEPCAPCSRSCEWSCEHQGRCKMPCSALCDRLPCDERCTKVLPCGHLCPSICGEACPANCCQQCGMKMDEKPDMLELKSYSDIELDESPIIALSCSHFFTIETLDGHIDLKEVYEQDPRTGHYIGMRENSQLAVNIPQCPYCKTPIRQFDTQRYNRLINKAVIDEMTKRFIVSSQQELYELETKLEELRTEIEVSRKTVVPDFTIPRDPGAAGRALENMRYWLITLVENRYADSQRLEQRVTSFQKRTATKHQPASKLHQATLHALEKNPGLDSAFERLNLSSSVPATQQGGDERIKHGGHLLYLKVQCLILEDKFAVARSIKDKIAAEITMPDALGGLLVTQAGVYLNNCINLIDGCKADSLPKLAVEATLYYSRVAQLLTSSGLANDEDRKQVEAHREKAKELLEQAATLCEQPFKGAKDLVKAVEYSLRLLGKEFYADVSKEEIEAIKRAMVTGPGGIATHSGHWYKCVKGHPFAIGECGMPMQLAKCPECGSPVGGQNHSAVDGVTRATEME